MYITNAEECNLIFIFYLILSHYILLDLTYRIIITGKMIGHSLRCTCTVGVIKKINIFKNDTCIPVLYRYRVPHIHVHTSETPLCSKYKINTVSTFPPNNRVTYSPNTLSYAFMICSLVNKIIMACGAQRP